jgi:hypothetical protein
MAPSTARTAPTFTRVRADLTRTLAAWSVASVAVGAVLARRGTGERTAGFARQSIAWGAVDLAIAGAGWLGERRPVTDEAEAARSLRRLLLVNAALDVGYLAAGVALVRAGRVRGRDSVGDGAAVVVQGGFLLVLDLLNAVRVSQVRELRAGGTTSV